MRARQLFCRTGAAFVLALNTSPLGAGEPPKGVALEEAPAWNTVLVAPVAAPAAVAVQAAAEDAAEAPAPQPAVEEEAVPVEVFIGAAAPAIQIEAAAAVGVEVDEDAQLAPLRAQYEPLLRAELSFANRVCKFSDEQRRQAIAAGVRWLEEFARQQVNGNKNQQGGLFVLWAVGVRQQPADPAEAAESQLMQLVESVLTDQQKGEYESQLAHRTAFARQAIIDSMIAKMDETMDLSVEQRATLTKTLLARWDENWAPPVEAFIHMNEYVPSIPDEYVTPHLTEEQKKIWNGLQKVSFGRHNFGFNQFFNDAGIDDIDLKDLGAGVHAAE